MCMVFYTVQFSLPIFIVFNKDKETAKIWPPATNGSFPLSGTGQYITVWFGVAHPDPACISTANSTLTW